MTWTTRALTQKLVRLITAMSLSALVIVTNGCEGLSWNEKQTATQVRQKGEIKVAILENPLVYRRPTKEAEAQGLEYDLLRHFASTYSLKIRFYPKATTLEVTKALEAGEVDLAAARLWTPEESEGLLAGPTLEESHLSLFCLKTAKIDHVKDLANRRVLLMTSDNDGYIDIKLHQFVPSLTIESVPAGSGRGLFKKLMAGRADCAIAEDLQGSYYLRAFPEIVKTNALKADQSLGWLLRPDRNDLNELLKAWFQRASRDDEIMRIQDRYRAQMDELDGPDLLRFQKNVQRHLPTYAKAFRESALEHDLEWQLVAAVAYQESHWDPKAVSPTGVRGLMQLTEDTADLVGISDRRDPLQSIWGGATYLRTILNSMPEGLAFQDRVALTLAAYNSGLGHLKDVQSLAIERGLNPYSWRHLKTIYPLLESPRIANRLPSGAARGRETVQFVDRVRAFHDLFYVINSKI